MTVQSQGASAPVRLLLNELSDFRQVAAEELSYTHAVFEAIQAMAYS